MAASVLTITSGCVGPMSWMAMPTGMRCSWRPGLPNSNLVGYSRRWCPQGGWVAVTSSDSERTSQPRHPWIRSPTCASAPMSSPPGSSRRRCWPALCTAWRRVRFTVPLLPSMGSRPGRGSVRRAATLHARLPDYGWRVSTGPLVWNRAKDRISAHRRDGSVTIVWAADLEDGTLRCARIRQPQRWLALGPDDDRALVLDRPALLVARTTAPEQPRRLIAAELDAGCLARWGGRVVVENHVNVLTCLDAHSPLTAR